MPTIKRNAIIPYQTSQMYDLVDGIENYPNFLPWCTEAKVLSRDADEVKATLTLNVGGFYKSFTTCNRLQPHKMIEMRLVEGPFKHLEGFWRFEHLDEKQCNVMLDLEFEFSSRLVSLTIEPVFQHVTNSLVDAFCQRAHAVYGQKLEA